MTGRTTTSARASVLEACGDVKQLAAGLIGRLPSDEASPIANLVRRVPASAERAVRQEQSWMRSSLDTTIRRDLLDLHYYAMRYRERELADACGRTLNDIDRRAQEEASPVFDPAS